MSRALRLGFFVLLSLGIIVAAVFVIGSKEMMFKSSYKLKTGFKNVAGLMPGANVRVGGLQKGTVQRIDLPKDPSGNVVVVMDMSHDTQDILKRDSVASIKSEGLVGDKFVEISFGSSGAPKLKDGDTIQSAPPLDIADVVTKTNQMLDSATVAIQNVQQTAENLTSITSKINKGEGTAGALINDKTMYNEANASVAALHDDMEALKHNFLVRGFFKKRGYEDQSDLTKYQVASVPPGPYQKVFTYSGKDLFGKPDSGHLKNEKQLNEVGAFLQNQKSGMVVIAASMGMKGDTQKDRTLTEARAFAVRDYLVRTFRFDDTRLKTIGLGKTADGEDDGKIEIMVLPAGKTRADNQAPGRPE